MRKILFTLTIFLTFSAYSQRPTQMEVQKVADSITKAKADSANIKPKPTTNNNNGSTATNAESKQAVKSGSNKRISIIVGLGASIFPGSLYVDPIVNPTNNFVQLQSAKNVKSNISLGIAYTPYIHDVISSVSSVNEAGNIVTRNEVESGPRGITFAAFVNPVLLSKISENQNFFNSTDFGIGIGFRGIGGFSILGSAELFWVRQPRDWFIEQYKGNNTSYSVGGAVQKSIDVNDNNIFTSKPVFSIGFKLAYTFDIIKSFTSTTSTILTPTSSSTTPTGNKQSPQQKPDSTSTSTKPRNQ